MKEMSIAKRISLCAMCIALCYVLPIAFHAIGLGSALSPMHIPVLLCGLICGGWWGALCGIVGPVLLRSFEQRIVNIHPSLLPSFKGAHAIQDAVDYGVKIFGVTTHFVDETLDGGRIIDQGAVVYEGSDIEELTNLIHKIEHNLYVKTINKLINKKF